MPAMKAFGLRLLEALPLSVFLLYMLVVDPRAQDEWRTPYYAATALAMAGVVVLSIKRRNRAASR